MFCISEHVGALPDQRQVSFVGANLFAKLEIGLRLFFDGYICNSKDLSDGTEQLCLEFTFEPPLT